MSNISVRELEPDDYLDIGELMLHEKGGVFGNLNSIMQDMVIEKLEIFGPNEIIHFYAASIDEKTVGYLQLSHYKSWAHMRIENIYVHQDHRGEGVGTAMIKHLKAHPRKTNQILFSEKYAGKIHESSTAKKLGIFSSNDIYKINI